MNTTWHTDEEMKKQLYRHEGRKLYPYRCTSGKLTIGVGRNLDDVGISAFEADLMLENDIKSVEHKLDFELPWWRELTRARQMVLIDMGFNLGVPGLLKFKNTLALLRKGDFDATAQAMLNSKWASQVGHRAHRLAEMMRKG